MTESKLKKKKIDSEFNNRNNENLITGRSSKSLDQLTLRNNIISPWSGDQYYSKIKSDIAARFPKSRRSATAHSLNSKSKMKNRKSVSKNTIKTTQLQLVPMPNQTLIINKIKTKLNNRFHTSLKDRQCNFFQNNELSNKIEKDSFLKCPIKNDQQTENFKALKAKDPIHSQYKVPSNKQIPKQKMKIEKFRTEESSKFISHKFYTNGKIHFNQNIDKTPLLFYFEAKHNINLLSKQKKIMKIRNLQKQRINKIFANLV